MAPEIVRWDEPLTERVVNRLRQHHQRGLHRVPDWRCPICAGRLFSGVQGAIQRDDPTVYCQRCRCYHFPGGRCFADDETGWPIVQRAADIVAKAAYWEREQIRREIAEQRAVRTMRRLDIDGGPYAGRAPAALR